VCYEHTIEYQSTLDHLHRKPWQREQNRYNCHVSQNVIRVGRALGFTRVMDLASIRGLSAMRPSGFSGSEAEVC